MNSERKKVPLLLMEQLIMVFVFALTATFCIQAFVVASQISKESQAKDQAVNLAQNVIETLIATKGNLEELESIFGGNANGDNWTLTLDENWSESDISEFTVIVNEKGGDGYLGEAKIIVKNQKESVLFEQNVAWQEVLNRE